MKPPPKPKVEAKAMPKLSPEEDLSADQNVSTEELEQQAAKLVEQANAVMP